MLFRLHISAINHSSALEQLLSHFADPRYSLAEIREQCRVLGAVHRRKGIEFHVEGLKAARSALTKQLDITASKTATVHKLVSFLLFEMKNGALCAAVESKEGQGYIDRKDRRSLSVYANGKEAMNLSVEDFSSRRNSQRSIERKRLLSGSTEYTDGTPTGASSQNLSEKTTIESVF